MIKRQFHWNISMHSKKSCFQWNLRALENSENVILIHEVNLNRGFIYKQVDANFAYIISCCFNWKILQKLEKAFSTSLIFAAFQTFSHRCSSIKARHEITHSVWCFIARHHSPTAIKIYLPSSERTNGRCFERFHQTFFIFLEGNLPNEDHNRNSLNRFSVISRWLSWKFRPLFPSAPGNNSLWYKTAFKWQCTTQWNCAFHFIPVHNEPWW